MNPKTSISSKWNRPTKKHVTSFIFELTENDIIQETLDEGLDCVFDEYYKPEIIYSHNRPSKIIIKSRIFKDARNKLMKGWNDKRWGGLTIESHFRN